MRSSLSHGHTQHAVQQVKDYIESLAKAERRQVEDGVDLAAAALWGLTEQELADVKASLKQLNEP